MYYYCICFCPLMRLLSFTPQPQLLEHTHPFLCITILRYHCVFSSYNVWNASAFHLNDCFRVGAHCRLIDFNSCSAAALPVSFTVFTLGDQEMASRRYHGIGVHIRPVQVPTCISDPFHMLRLFTQICLTFCCCADAITAPLCQFKEMCLWFKSSVSCVVILIIPFLNFTLCSGSNMAEGRFLSLTSLTPCDIPD